MHLFKYEKLKYYVLQTLHFNISKPPFFDNTAHKYNDEHID